MEKIIIYRADDGKFFNDERACREHDIQIMLNDVDESVECFDGEKEPLPLTAEGYSEAKYLWIEDNWAAIKLEEVCRYWSRSCRGLKGRGMYQWNSFWNSWELFDVNELD